MLSINFYDNDDEPEAGPLFGEYENFYCINKELIADFIICNDKIKGTTVHHIAKINSDGKWEVNKELTPTDPACWGNFPQKIVYDNFQILEI